MAVRKQSSFQVSHVNSSSSDTSTSSSSSTGSDPPLKRFNRLLRKTIARRWTYIRRDSPALKTCGRSNSDAGLCALVDNDPDLDYLGATPRRSLQPLKRASTYVARAGVTVPKVRISAAGGGSSVTFEDQSDGSDAERSRRNHHYLRVPTPVSHGQSTGNFASGSVGAGGCGAPRSAPATPLQLDPPPRTSKHDKQVVKPLSSSVPSVSAGALPNSAGAGSGGSALSDASDSKAPSKARQKKFFRHFPQVPPDEKVLNYYSCALVGDILLQGHLYITKNYFAFYSNVFGYVTKLLIPTSSVVRVTKEKMARIIPNAVGVCTRDERHVFGSLLSRDSTHKLMTHVWKAARAPELATPPPSQDLRISEAELDASEYSPDESSSGVGEDVIDSTHPINRRESEAIIAGSGTAIIQPALLTGATSSLSSHKSDGFVNNLLLVAILMFTFTAIFLGYRIYSVQQQENLDNISGDELYSELMRWQARLHGRAASELQAFLTTNLMLLTKVRQSLEALSGVILTDISHGGVGNLDVPNDTTYS